MMLILIDGLNYILNGLKNKRLKLLQSDLDIQLKKLIINYIYLEEDVEIQRLLVVMTYGCTLLLILRKQIDLNQSFIVKNLSQFIFHPIIKFNLYLNFNKVNRLSKLN